MKNGVAYCKIVLRNRTCKQAFTRVLCSIQSGWPDWAKFCHLGDFLWHWAKFFLEKNRPKLTLIRLKFCSKRGFLHVSKIFKNFYLLFYVKKTIKECPVPLDISIKSNRNTIKQFYIVNLTKTWLGNFLGNFSLSLGDFLTETSGHPDSIPLPHSRF